MTTSPAGANMVGEESPVTYNTSGNVEYYNTLGKAMWPHLLSHTSIPWSPCK